MFGYFESSIFIIVLFPIPLGPLNTIANLLLHISMNVEALFVVLRAV